MLTDTTERSPTFCTPPFRKFDDRPGDRFVGVSLRDYAESPRAWERIIKRVPRCVEWPETRTCPGAIRWLPTVETIRKISYPELMRFRMGLDGMNDRRPARRRFGGHRGRDRKNSLLAPDGFTGGNSRRAATGGRDRTDFFWKLRPVPPSGGAGGGGIQIRAVVVRFRRRIGCWMG